MNEQREPRQIHKIGFGYKLDFMPAPLVLGYHQLAKKIEQAGFKIKVSLVPLNDLGSDCDLLFVPKQLEAEAARALDPERVIALDEFVNQPAYAELIKRLEQGTEICAKRIDPGEAGNEEGMIVRYRGYDRID